MAHATYHDPAHVIDLTPDFLKTYNLDIPTVDTAGLSSSQLSVLIREVGFAGKAVQTFHNGRAYLLLKGRAGFRPNLTGTRYAAANPKIVTFAIGLTGQASSARSVTIIGFILYTGIEILEALLNDRSTLSQFFGSLAVELTKAAIAGLAGAAMTAVIGTVTTLVAAPLVIGILVSVGAAMVLNQLDREFRVSDLVTGILEELGDRTVGEVARMNLETERWIISYVKRRLGLP
ncbi:MAG: hypothetical protein P1U88_21600 [Thalassobaculaceae bacterium]|nr:hypothetical protein [Thalassobaculaceae bacterium]